MEVTPAEFARQSFVSKQAVNGKIKNKTLIVNSAGKLDTDNPVNRAYLNKHQAKVKNTKALASSPDLDDFVSQNQITASSIQSMTFSEIIKNFGSMEGIDKFVKLQKDLVTIEEKDQRLQEKRLQQLPRDFVIARLFGFQQQQASRILDVPEAAADQLQAIVLANPSDSRQKIIDYLRDLLSRAIGGAKEHIINELQSLKAKYSDDSESLSDKIDALMEANQ